MSITQFVKPNRHETASQKNEATNNTATSPGRITQDGPTGEQLDVYDIE